MRSGPAAAIPTAESRVRLSRTLPLRRSALAFGVANFYSAEIQLPQLGFDLALRSPTAMTTMLAWHQILLRDGQRLIRRDAAFTCSA